MTEPVTTPLPRSTPALVLMLVAALFPMAILTYNHMTEDAFITFRYVEQIARGNGAVYNIGDRVEGFSNPLWTVLLVPVAWTPVRLHVAARLLSVAFLGMLVLVAYWGSRRWLERYRAGVPVAWAWWLAIATALQPYLNYHRDLGLETVSYAAFQGGMLLAVALSRWRLAAAAGIAVAWSRPEGPGFVMALWVVAAWECLRRKPGWDPRAWWPGCRGPLAFVAATLAGWLVLQAARLAYFDAWVPNTVTAKDNGVQGWRPLLVMLGSWWGFPLLGAIGAGWSFARDRGNLLALGAMGLIAATAVFQLLSGNLFQVGLRYLVPAVFPSLVGIWLLVLEARRQFGAAPIRAAAVALLVLNTVLPFSWRNPYVRGIHNDDPNVRLHVRLWQVVRDRNPVAKSEWYFSDPIMLNAQAGRWLRDEFLPRHRKPGLVLAADQMGMLGYYAPHDVPIVDMLGLMDRQVASQKFSPYDLALYLLYRGADFIVLYAHRPEERLPWVTSADVNRAAIHALRPTMEEPPISELYTVWAAIRPANDVESFQFLVYGRREGAPAEPEIVVLGPDTDEFLRAWRVTAPEDVPRMLFD